VAQRGRRQQWALEAAKEPPAQRRGREKRGERVAGGVFTLQVLDPIPPS
jgi:hypothetical protein